jgi:hypothetical protein
VRWADATSVCATMSCPLRNCVPVSSSRLICGTYPPCFRRSTAWQTTPVRFSRGSKWSQCDQAEQRVIVACFPISGVSWSITSCLARKAGWTLIHTSLSAYDWTHSTLTTCGKASTSSLLAVYIIP